MLPALPFPRESLVLAIMAATVAFQAGRMVLDVIRAGFDLPARRGR